MAVNQGVMIEWLTDAERAPIEEAFDAAWLHKQADKLSQRIRDQAGKRRIKSPDQLHQHPLMWPWLACTGTVPSAVQVHANNFEVALLRGLSATLGSVWPHLDGESRALAQTRLRDKDRWEKTFYELRIAAHYATSGLPVRVVPEDQRHPSPDLKVTTEAGGVFIECKKKDLVTQRDKAYAGFWNAFRDRAMARLEKLQRSVSVIIVADDDPELREIDYLIGGIEQALARGLQGTVYDNEKFTLTWETLAPWDARIPGDFQANFVNVDHIAMHLDVEIGMSPGEQWSRNIRILGVRSNHRPNRLPSVLANVRTAAKQLPEMACGLVYVELPLPPSERFDYEVEQLASGLEKQLRTVNRRVNAVVLTASGLIATGPGQLVFAQRQRAVWHADPRTPLPTGFTLPPAATTVG